MREKKSQRTEAEQPEVKEKPHPLLRVPGVGTRPVWSKSIGRWVVPVIGGEISDERSQKPNGNTR